MGCGLDLVCYAQGAVTSLIDWLLSFVSFNTLVMLWIGTAIGAKWGWPALIAETIGLAALFYKKTGGDYPTDLPEKDATVPKRVKFPRRTRQPAGKRKTLKDWFKGLGKK